MTKFSKSNLTKTNLIILIVGILLITIGYIILGKGDITISPIILIIGYLVIIPVALLYPTK